MCLWAVPSYIHTSPPKERKSMLPFQFINNLLTPKNRKQLCFIFSEKSQWSNLEVYTCTKTPEVCTCTKTPRSARNGDQQQLRSNSKWTLERICDRMKKQPLLHMLHRIKRHQPHNTSRLIAIVTSSKKILLYLISVLFVSKSCLQLPVITVEMTI